MKKSSRLGKHAVSEGTKKKPSRGKQHGGLKKPSRVSEGTKSDFRKKPARIYDRGNG